MYRAFFIGGPNHGKQITLKTLTDSVFVDVSRPSSEKPIPVVEARYKRHSVELWGRGVGVFYVYIIASECHLWTFDDIKRVLIGYELV